MPHGPNSQTIRCTDGVDAARRRSSLLVVSVCVLVAGGATFPAGPAYGQACQEQKKLTASDGAEGDSFGRSVAISGDNAIVGAYWDDDLGTNSGAAYMFVHSVLPGEEVWTQQKLTASDGASNDQFGWSVSISGDTAIVGARWDNAPATDSGSVYVFVRSGPFGEEVWTQQQKLTAFDGAVLDEFGFAVAISGNTVIVGAPGDDAPAAASGSAYLFVRSDGVWTLQQKLIASDGAADDKFGSSVSISGDTAIVGAWTDDAPAIDSGSAYVFVRSGPPGEEMWTQQQKLTATDGEAGDIFGLSVSISGETTIVGAAQDDDLGNSSGSAYVFVRSGPPGEEMWTQRQKLTASDGKAGDRFGHSVSISGDTAIVGAVNDDAPASGSGSAYVFVRSGGVWTPQQKLTASDGAEGDEFGWSVSISGDTTIVGARWSDAPASNSGSAYVFECPNVPACAADINGDETVNVDDLLAMINTWGRCADPKNCPADLNDDGTVNIIDLLAVINAWGPCTLPPSQECANADITNNRIVNVADLLIVINNWQP